jgi:small subunit ribosomal protein S2
MKIPSMEEMLEAGVHFGHSTSRWYPKMKPFIYFERHGVHVIDLEKTRSQLEIVLAEVKAMVADGKNILFVSTKPQAREIVKQAAIDCDMPYLVDRWVGGLLTNFPEMKKLFKKYLGLKEQQASGELERYTKQERTKIGKDLVKMDETLGGIAKLERVPDAIFVPALQHEKTAVTEANSTGVPIIAVCDTNANPDNATFVIPANDDATRSISMMVGLVAEAVKEGRAEREKRAAAVKKEV